MKKIVSRFADEWSNISIPILSFFFPSFISLWTAFFFPPAYSIFLHYFIIGIGGSLPTVILFLLARPYPFSPYSYADMCHLQAVASLGIEERKVLTFWKKSEEVKRVVWKSETYFLIFALLVALISFALSHIFDRRIVAHLFNVSIGKVSWQTNLFELFANVAIYFIFSFLFIGYRLARFLKKNIDRIAAMDIEPWPAHTPYAPASLSFMNRPEQPEGLRRSYIDELLRMDPKTPFTWSGFIRIMMIPITLILSWIVAEKLLSPIFKQGIKHVITYFAR